jgi:hypothetical protein
MGQWCLTRFVIFVTTFRDLTLGLLGLSLRLEGSYVVRNKLNVVWQSKLFR